MAGCWAAKAWEAYALNALALAVFPPLLADAIRRLAVDRWLPGNFFRLCLRHGVLWRGAYRHGHGYSRLRPAVAGRRVSGADFADDYLPYYFLLGFAEAWLNGALITLMVVYCRTGSGASTTDAISCTNNPLE
jgi:uncharacterized membrane protein